MPKTQTPHDLDNKAKNIGLIVGISEEVYFCSISHVSVLYVELINNEWVAWRETYLPYSKQCKSYKYIARGNFDLIIARCKQYLKFIKKKRGL